MRFLGLFLNTSGVHTVEVKVVVIASPTGETDGALIAATVILRERCQQREARPVAPIDRKIGDLSGCRRLDLHGFANRADSKLRIECSGLADLQYHVLDDLGFEAGTRNCQGVTANRQARSVVVPVSVGPLLLCNGRVHGQDFDACSTDGRPRLIGYSAFEYRAINLGKRWRWGDGRQDRDHQRSLKEREQEECARRAP